MGIVSRDYGMSITLAGALVTVTQLGYATGLLFVVPLGDILENRRLILIMLAILVVALAIAFFAPSAALFLLASLAIGVSSSAVQIIVPFAGHLSDDATRGRVVGNVVSGLLFGIMLSRPAASFAAQFIGPRSIFALSAGAIVLLALVLAARLPSRRPEGIPYLQILASLGPLLRDTKALHRRGAYQAAMFGGFSLFWTAVPLLPRGSPIPLLAGWDRNICAGWGRRRTRVALRGPGGGCGPRVPYHRLGPGRGARRRSSSLSPAASLYPGPCS